MALVGSQIEASTALVAVGKFVQQASPVWALMKGFSTTITQVAAGHYSVQLDLEWKSIYVDLTLEGNISAAHAPAVYFTDNGTGGLDIFTSFNGALADVGQVHIKVHKNLNG